MSITTRIKSARTLLNECRAQQRGILRAAADGTVLKGYATLAVKGFEKGVIAGLASHIAADRSGDIVMPKGLQFKLPLPLRFEHKETVGEIFAANVTDDGLEIEARLSDPEEAKSATIRERLLTAWDSVRLGLAKGLSVGMLPIRSEPTGKGFGRKFLEAELVEVSIVSIPDQRLATISTVKSFAQQIQSQGRTLNDVESDEYDLLEAEAKMLEREIAMLGELLEREAATAKPPRSWED